MMSPTTGALASSVACIATASSWWAAVRRTRASSKQAWTDRNALRTRGVVAMSARPTRAVHPEVYESLSRSGIFGKPGPDTVSALIDRVRLLRFPPGHVVFAQGDPGDCLYVVTSGKVKVAYRHVDGREIVLSVLGASEFFGEVAVFDDGSREFSATAVTDVRAVPIDRDQLLAWMAEFPDMVHRLMRLLARRAVAMTDYLDDVAFADPPYRVARRLLSLAKRFGRREGEAVRVMHDLTLDEISQFAGTAPEVVDATLREFANRGWIRFGEHCVELVDGHGLADVPARCRLSGVNYG